MRVQYYYCIKEILSNWKIMQQYALQLKFPTEVCVPMNIKDHDVCARVFAFVIKVDKWRELLNEIRVHVRLVEQIILRVPSHKMLFEIIIIIIVFYFYVHTCADLFPHLIAFIRVGVSYTTLIETANGILSQTPVKSESVLIKYRSETIIGKRRRRHKTFSFFWLIE